MARKRLHPSTQSTGPSHPGRKTKPSGSKPQKVTDAPYPLLEAFIAAKRGVPGAAETYRFHRERLDRLNDPDTPWEQRLKALEELEADGWKRWVEWPRLKHDLKFRGKEWQIPISSDQLKHLGTLHENEWLAYVAAIFHQWCEAHPELKDRILQDFEAMWPLSAQVACQVWAKDPAYSQWLMENIVKPAVYRVELSAASEASVYAIKWVPPVRKNAEAPATPKTREDLRCQGYSDLLGRIIPQHIKHIECSLVAYWRKALQYELWRHLAKERREYRVETLRRRPPHRWAKLSQAEQAEATREEWAMLKPKECRGEGPPTEDIHRDDASSADKSDEAVPVDEVVKSTARLQAAMADEEALSAASEDGAAAQEASEDLPVALDEIRRLLPRGAQQVLLLRYKAAEKGRKITQKQLARKLRQSLRTIQGYDRMIREAITDHRHRT